ncbi:MAG: CehA/McbA family metallohydrolase [Verrucomicrobiota bacterium]
MKTALVLALAAFITCSCWAQIGIIQPRLSPNGDRVAASYQGAIVTFTPNGGNLAVHTTAEGWDFEPTWSPDGTKIAFLRSPHFAGGRLHIVDVNTGEEAPLPKPIHGYSTIWWHPDGDRILGMLKPQAPRRLGWLDLESGEVTEIEVEGLGDDVRQQRMVWALSPDGSEMLYALHADVPGEQTGDNGPQAYLWRCNADGSDNRQICEWPARIYHLTWDSDARGCFIVTDRGVAHNDIWKLSLNAPLKSAMKLTYGQTDEERPSVSRQAESPLIYTTNRTGLNEVILHRFDSGTRIPLTVAPPDYDGSLQLKIADGAMTRVSVKKKNGKHFAPPDAMYRVTGTIGHFYTDGSQFELPKGDYEIIATRGLEYRPLKVDVTVGDSTEVEISLERWINLAERGWYSGENHVHANYGYGEWYNTPATILRQCQGEDLNICNAVIGNSDGDAVFDREFFLGKDDPLSTDTHIIRWNQEFRATLWGHLTLSRLPQLVEPTFTGFGNTTNPYDVPTNADIAQDARDIGGVVSYTHPASNALDLYDQAYAAKGSPIDVALGRVHALDVAGNTYPGSLQLWYHFLNCGFPVVASAGTDCFLNRVRSFPPGWARCYVKLDNGLHYNHWVDGQVAGRSFITNGPVVMLEVEGRSPGTTIGLDSPRRVRINAEALSHWPMDKVELIFNGEVIRQLPFSDDGQSAKFEGDVEIPHSGWIALSAEGPRTHLVYGRNMAAHTNPVRIQVANKPWRSTHSARYFLNWIDRLEADFEARAKLPTPQHRAGVIAQLEAAREVYREIAETGQ